MLLIDRAQNRIVPGGIFAVAIGEDVVIKYVDRTPGKIVLWSRNRDFPAIEVDLRAGLAESVRIIGRVLWWCRETK
jgi:phage repressor protein C with HTH and peptisase S24 domain